MKRSGCFLAGLFVLAVLGGCGGAQTDSQQAENPQDSPEQVLEQFLQAIRSGADEQAEGLLTPLALERTRGADLVVTPPGRDSASFEIGEVKYVADDGVHIESRWTDLDENGEPKTDEIVWMLRTAMRCLRIVRTFCIDL